MSRPQPLPPAPARLRIDYVDAAAPDALLADDRTLAVLGFGADAPRHDDPRYLRVPLQPHGQARFEVWRTDAPATHGRDGDIAWASAGGLQFGAVEIEEPPLAAGATDILAAAQRAYAALTGFVGGSRHPHLLRIWNHLDAITLGDSDTERYRQFSVGRARGIGDFDPGMLPAASAVGSHDGARRLQVYWLAAGERGIPVENPRQVSAYRYPRQYGPQAPSFARAMLPPAGSDMPLLLSGTAAIVGHTSQHAGELLAQLDEILRNFDSLLGEARRHRPALPERFGAGTRLKVYVRDPEDMPTVAAALDAHFGDRVPRILLHAAICRRELALEIDGVHGQPL